MDAEKFHELIKRGGLPTKEEWTSLIVSARQMQLVLERIADLDEDEPFSKAAAELVLKKVKES